MALNTSAPSYTSGQVVTAAQLNALQDGIQAAWTAYTPTASGGLTVGNGTWGAAYMRIGKTIHVRVLFTLGSTSAVASAISVSLPVAQLVNGSVVLAGHVLDSSAGATGRLPASAVGNGAGTVGVYTSGGSLTSTVPFTWATGDVIAFSGTYEAA